MLRLSSVDKAMLAGAKGEGAQLAMQMIVHIAAEFRATQLIDISWAHVASAYYQGQANLDFARRLRDANTKVAVPTTLTACSVNLRAKTPHSCADRVALQLMDCYTRMGCEAVMTCAPYHTRPEPRPGEHLAWCESSAVVYANSVLGARSNRYVEFVDMCAAVTGRVPDYGLHRSDARRATILFRTDAVPAAWLGEDWFFHVLGILIGRQSGSQVPAIAGLPASTSREQLRALGSAAASSGSLGMFHAVGITPEAATLEGAFQGHPPQAEFVIDAEALRNTAAGLGSQSDKPLTAVCVGAPHFSFAEFADLHRLLDDREVADNVRLYAATSAAVVLQLQKADLLDPLQKAGVQLVVGRCTYYRPAMRGTEGHVMTNSAKWAWYAPASLDTLVTFASLADCVESACAGRAITKGWL